MEGLIKACSIAVIILGVFSLGLLVVQNIHGFPFSNTSDIRLNNY